MQLVQMRVAALALAALAGLGFAGSPATRVYRDPQYGFVVPHPKTFHVEPFVDANPNQTLAGAAFGTLRDPVSGRDTKLPLTRATGGDVHALEHQLWG